MRYLAILGLVISVGTSAPARAVNPNLFSEPSVVRAPNGSCEASITQNPTGGFRVLGITRLRGGNREQVVEAKDVTGAVWMANDKLVYSLGPRYGSSGVFYFDCASSEHKRLVAATIPNEAYPHGADYFELDDLSRGANIWYYHVPDVALMDDPAFKKLDFLRRMDVTEPYAAHIAKAYPGARVLERGDFQSWIQGAFKKAGPPALATGRFNDDELEDFAVMFRPDPANDIEYQTVVCHALPQGGYDGCEQLSGGLAAKGTVRFYLIAHSGKAVCLASVGGLDGAGGDLLAERTIVLQTDGIGLETDVAASLFIYQPDDGSYWRCTTAD